MLDIESASRNSSDAPGELGMTQVVVILTRIAISILRLMVQMGLQDPMGLVLVHTVTETSWPSASEDDEGRKRGGQQRRHKGRKDA